MKRWAIIFIVIACVAGFFYVRHKRNNKEEIFTEKVERGDLFIRVQLTGMIEPKKRVNVKSRVEGRIKKIYAQEGNMVEEGQLIAEVDPEVVKARADEQQSNVSAAASQVQKAALSAALQKEQDELKVSLAKKAYEKALAQQAEAGKIYSRKQELLAQNFISLQEVDSAKTNVSIAKSEAESQKDNIQLSNENLLRDEKISQQEIQSAKARLQGAKASYKAALENLQYTKVYAPLAGLVTYRGVEEGELVASESFGKQSGTTIVTVSDLSEMYATADVDEVDMAKLKTGQKAEIILDAIPEKKFKGEIVEIGMQSSRIQNPGANEISTFPLKIKIISSDKRLKPGMSCNIDVPTAHLKNVLYVPLEVVERKDGKDIVKVKKGDDNVVEKTVITGTRTPTDIEILKGLKKGDEVVLPISSSEDEQKNTQQGRGRHRGLGGGRRR